MASTIYKPETTKGPVVLIPDGEPRGTVTITTKDGRTYTGRYLNTNEGRHQYVFPPEITGETDLKISYNGTTGTIPDGSKALEGGTAANWSPRAGGKGDIGSGLSGVPGQFTPGGAGQFGVAPAFIGNMFPKAATINHIDPTPYQFIDPVKFGQQFNGNQRSEFFKNFSDSKSLALDTVDTELRALLGYVPRSAELKRSETGKDNTFNQAERTRQVYSAVPDVAADLTQQAADARSYAAGKAPDSVIDSALTLADRSASADAATYAGFGVKSSASRKLSDLMSAKDRIQLSQYGNQLLSSNAAQREELFLAPTEYSNAGGQVNVNPTISAGQVQVGQAASLNQSTLLDPNATFSNITQQSQFVSGLTERFNQFNSGIDQFNANNINNFALSYFNYLNSYVNSVAGAQQTDINTNLELDQQAAARDEANKQKGKTQHANDVKNGIVAGAAVVALLAFSDENLKEDIQTFNVGLDIINKINVVSYRYKEDTTATDDGRIHVGVLAQELLNIIPNAVIDTREGYMVDHSNIIYVLVNAVKELSAQVKSLSGSVGNLDQIHRVYGMAGQIHGIG